MSDFPLIAEVHRHVQVARALGAPLIVGVAGSVAVGKSTFAAGLADAMGALADGIRITTAATDGFLFPNAVLEERNLSLRKGYPESYDIAAMQVALAGVKAGLRTALPRYSHVTYDVDHGNPLIVERPDVLILDGLHLAQVERPDRAPLIDVLIYLDAPEDVLEGWFTARLIPLMKEGRDDPSSFYYRFRALDDAQCADFAKRVWEGINLPNLRQHIVKDRDAAHYVVTKASDHSVVHIERREQ
jgi:type I pantothenate kinase